MLMDDCVHAIAQCIEISVKNVFKTRLSYLRKFNQKTVCYEAVLNYKFLCIQQEINSTQKVLQNEKLGPYKYLIDMATSIFLYY